MQLLKGFRFGMLLQLAIGPVCIFVFDTAVAQGFGRAFQLVCAAGLVDAGYIFVSGLGATTLLQNPRVQTVCRWFGGGVLLLFGLNTLLGTCGISVLPQIALFSADGAGNLFIKGILLTASNPLTIVFWGGVLSAQLLEHHLSRGQLAAFGAGCVMSTLLFLSAVALCGSIVSNFFSAGFISLLNGLVGCALVFFGLRLWIKKPD